MGILNLIDQYIQNSGLGNTTSGILGGSQPQGGLLSGSPVIPFNPTQNTLPTTQTPTAPIGDQSQNWKVGLGQQNPYSFALSQMGDIIGGWGKTPLQQSETLKNRADAQLAQAQTGAAGAQIKRVQMGLSNGDTPEAAAYNSRVMFHVQQGDSLPAAQAKAYNEVGIKPQVGPNGVVIQANPIPVPGDAPSSPAAPGTPMSMQNPMQSAQQGQGIPGVGNQLLAGPNGQPSVTTNNPMMQPPLVAPTGIQQQMAAGAGAVKGSEQQASTAVDQLKAQRDTAQKDYDNSRRMVSALESAKSLATSTFDAQGGPPTIKADVSAFMGSNNRKVDATNAYEANVNQALSPIMLNQDVGPNGQFRMMTEGVKAAKASLSDVNQPISTRLAILNPYSDQAKGIMAMSQAKMEAADKGQLWTPQLEQQTAQQLGIDPYTYRPAGKNAVDYLSPSGQPQQKSPGAVRVYNPKTGKLE